MIGKTFNIIDALNILAPNTEWSISGDIVYSNINWLDSTIEQPSEFEIYAQITKLQNEYNALEYQRLRAVEYPDFKDYLDGIVKNDQEQIQAYINACLAIKEKYPKPIES